MEQNSGSKKDEQKRFIGIREVTDIAGFSKSSILRKIQAREFPAPVIQDRNRAGDIAVTRWDAAEIYRWREEQFRKRDERLKVVESAIDIAGAEG